MKKEVSFYFPVIKKQITMKYREIKELDDYEAVILVILIEFSKLNIYKTLHDIFKDTLNVQEEVLIRKFWLKIVRKLNKNNILTINDIDSIEDADLLLFDTYSISINEKVKNYILHNKFYGLHEDFKEEKENIFVKPSILSDEYKEYFKKSEITNKTYNNDDIKLKLDVSDLERKKTELENKFEQKYKDKKILLELSSNKKDIWTIYKYKSEVDLEFRILTNKIILLKIQSLTKDNLIFFKDFHDNNFINEFDNKTHLINYLFPNNTFFKEIKKIPINDTKELNIDNINQWLFEEKSSSEFANKTINNKEYIIYKNKIFILVPFIFKFQIDANDIIEFQEDLYIPQEICEKEYNEITNYLFENHEEKNDKEIISSLKPYYSKFMSSCIVERINPDLSFFIKVWEFLGNWIKDDKKIIEEMKQLFSVNIFVNVFKNINTYNDLRIFTNKFDKIDNVLNEITNNYNIDINNLKIFDIEASYDNAFLISIVKKEIENNGFEYINNNSSFQITKFWQDTVSDPFNNYQKLKERVLNEINNKDNNTIINIKKLMLEIKSISFLGDFYLWEHVPEIKKFIEEEMQHHLIVLNDNWKEKALELRQRLEGFVENKNTPFSNALKNIDPKLSEYYKKLSNIIHDNDNINKKINEQIQKGDLSIQNELNEIKTYCDNFDKKE